MRGPSISFSDYSLDDGYDGVRHVLSKLTGLVFDITLTDGEVVTGELTAVDESIVVRDLHVTTSSKVIPLEMVENLEYC